MSSVETVGSDASVGSADVDPRPKHPFGPGVALSHKRRSWIPSLLTDLVRATRPKDWAKNVFVLAPAVFGESFHVATFARAALDWRDFLTWRLTVEDELIGRRDEAGFPHTAVGVPLTRAGCTPHHRAHG